MRKEQVSSSKRTRTVEGIESLGEVVTRQGRSDSRTQASVSGTKREDALQHVRRVRVPQVQDVVRYEEDEALLEEDELLLCEDDEEEDEALALSPLLRDTNLLRQTQSRNIRREKSHGIQGSKKAKNWK